MKNSFRLTKKEKLTGLFLVKKLTSRLLNTAVRLGSLGAKLFLVLYITKGFTLDDVGSYGLVTAIVAIAIPLIGFRIDYCALRDIVGLSPFQTALMLRDQLVFYFLNYLIFLFCFYFVARHLNNEKEATYLMYAAILSVLESLASLTSGNLVSTGRPVIANCLFFIRSASWVPFVILFGVISLSFHNLSSIFNFWLGGVTLSLMLNVIIWAKMPWKSVFLMPINWLWVRRSLKIALPIWIGSVSLAGAGNVDRFIIETNLGRSYVGILSFFASLAVVIPALLNSSIFFFQYPKLILSFKNKDLNVFNSTSKNTANQALCISCFLAVALALAVPFILRLIGKDQLFNYIYIFWSILAAAVIRGATEVVYYIQYAQEADKPLWMSNLLYLGSSIILTFIFTKTFGFPGYAISVVLSNMVLAGYRIYWLLQNKKNV